MNIIKKGFKKSTSYDIMKFIEIEYYIKYNRVGQLLNKLSRNGVKYLLNLISRLIAFAYFQPAKFTWIAVAG